MKKYIYAVFLLVFAVLGLPTFASAAGNVGGFHLYQEAEDGSWEEAGVLNFPVDYGTQEVLLAPAGGEVTLRVSHDGLPFADIEQMRLTACSMEFSPEYARNQLTGEDLSFELMHDDLNVVAMDEGMVEVSWDVPYWCVGQAKLSVKANEYDHGFPLMMPVEGFLDFGPSVDVYDAVDMKVDGELGEVDGVLAPSYQFTFTPDSGHPEGETYVYVLEDKNHYYFSLDITADNTDEWGEDWLKIGLRMKDGTVREFYVDDYVDEYGVCTFGESSKVSYGHQMCEVAVPKDELGGDFDGLKLWYYGTAASVYIYESVRGVDGNAYYRRYTYSGEVWTSWKKSGSAKGKVTTIRAFLGSYVIVQARRGSNNGIYIRTTTDGVTWSDWVMHGKTKGDISLEVFNPGGGNQLYMAVKGTDNKIYTCHSADGQSWSSWSGDGYTPSDVAMVRTGVGTNRLYQAVRGMNNKVYYRYTADGDSWTSWKPVGGSTTTTPALHEYSWMGSRLYMAVRGTDGYVYTQDTTDGSWGSWEKCGKAKGTIDFSTAYYGEWRLYQAVRGTDDSPYQRYSANGTTWSGWSKVGGQKAADDILMTIDDQQSPNRLYYVVRGSDNGVYMTYSTDGSSFGDWEQSGSMLDEADMAFR